jgi:hypothetical protein
VILWLILVLEYRRQAFAERSVFMDSGLVDRLWRASGVNPQLS